MRSGVAFSAAALAALVGLGPPALAQSLTSVPPADPAIARLQDRADALQNELRRVTDEKDRLRFERDQLQSKVTQLEKLVNDLLAQQTAQAAPPPSEAVVAAPPPDASAGPAPNAAEAASAAYGRAFGLMQARDYGAARAAFGDFLQQYPGDALAAPALYWSARAAAALGAHAEAASEFVQLLKAHPKSSQAADGALRLGQSLLRLDQKPQACAAFAQAGANTAAPAETRQMARQEAAAAKC